MHSMKQAFVIAGQNYLGWKRSPRVWMTFVLAFVLCLMLSGQMIDYAQRYELSVQILEPFIWTYGDADSVMLSSLLLLLLFADMPFVNQSTPYCLIRTRRKIWLAGQVIYVITATVLYNLFLLLALAVMSAPFAYWGNVWSKTAAMLGYGEGQITIPVSVKTMESMLPYECAGWVFLLVVLYFLLMVMVMLCLNLLGGNMAGVLGALGMNLYGFLLNPEIFQKLFQFTGSLEYKAYVLCGWMSPLNHATFSMHNFGYDYLPKIQTSAGLFAILIIICSAAAIKKMRTYNFSFTQIDE